MEIDDRWFDVISPERQTILVLNESGEIELKEMEAYVILFDRKSKKAWLGVSGVYSFASYRNAIVKDTINKAAANRDKSNASSDVNQLRCI